MTDTPSGLLVVNKPSGPTSHDIVAQARRLFGTRAIGHAGTLDPMATGVLLLLVEEATKLSAALTLDSKSYLATIRFGLATDSDDALGLPINTCPIVPGWLTNQRLETALTAERDRFEQIPPRVSAIKLDGVTAYRKHRRGEAIELPARNVRIHDLTILAWSDEQVMLHLSVSKGYYVRALARDLGITLDMPAHLCALCRTTSGCFRLEEATDWPCAEVPRLLSMTEVVQRVMPTRTLTAEGVRRARLGQILGAEHFAYRADPVCDNGSLATTAWLDETESLVALGRAEPDGTARVIRGFRILA
jgi:tRNA pseudouridine55 synthase